MSSYNDPIISKYAICFLSLTWDAKIWLHFICYCI